MDPSSPSFYFALENFVHKKLFLECDLVWEALVKLSTYLHTLPLGKIEGEVSPNAYLVNRESIYIGPETIVEEGAYIRGPCYIGSGCQIRHGAYIRGNVLAGDRCVIGHATEVKDAILLNDVAAGHFAYLGNTILGHKVNLGAGVKCANLRLDRGAIVIKQGGQTWDTGLHKLGLVAGDKAQIGCNAVSNPGTLMGPDSFCYPNVNFGGVVPPKTILKSSAKIISARR
jgi:NDP-sugar pyrophosphorylase family protein